MLNSNRLLSIMALFGDNQKILAEKIQMNRSLLCKKINKLADFKLSDIEKIRKIYNLTDKDITDIFFD